MSHGDENPSGWIGSNGNPRRATKTVTCGMRGHSHLTHLGPTGGMGKRREKEKKKRDKERVLEREALPYL